MKNNNKTREQLLKELEKLNTKIAELERFKTKRLSGKQAGKQSEKELTEKTMLLDYVINRASNLAIATTDLDMRITLFNPVAEKFFGYPAREVLGKTVMEMHLMEKVYPERLEKAFEIVKKTGEYNYILNQELQNGKRVLSSRVTGLLDPTEKLVGYVLFHRDVTELVLAEEALRESENNLRTLFNAMTDIVFEIDYNGRYINIAPTSPELMFKPTKETIGKTLHEVFPKPEADKFLEFVRNCLDKNEINTLAYPLIINDKTIWFEGRATPKTENTVLYIARDITKRKQAEEEMQKLAAVVKHSSELINLSTLDGRMTFLNESGGKMLGIEPHEVKNVNIWKLFPII